MTGLELIKLSKNKFIKTDSNKISKMFFLLFCFSLLVAPLLNINKEKISWQENRRLATYRDLYDTTKKSFNFSYGTDVENYLKDRFWGRYELVEFSQIMRYFLAFRYVYLDKIIIDKVKKEMYGTLAINDLYTNIEQRNIANEIHKFYEYFKSRGVKVYFAILPTKDMIYNLEFIKDNNEYIQNILDNIRRYSGVDIIFPLAELTFEKKSDSYFFYKTDSHQTDDGAFIAYNALMKRIQKDFSDIKTVSISEFTYKQSNQTAYLEDRNYNIGGDFRKTALPENIGKKYLFVPYKYYSHKDKKHLQRKRITTDKLLKNSYTYTAGSEHNVLVIGDSSIENLMIFLPYSFKSTSKIRINGPSGIIGRYEQFKLLRNYKKEIEKINPDIMVIYVNYGHLGYLENLTK